MVRVKKSGFGLIGLLGLLICGFVILRYSIVGFSAYMPAVLLAGCALMLRGAFRRQNLPASSEAERSTEPGRIVRRDWIAVGALFLVFFPLYTIGVHDFPRQMNTDEIVIMNTARTLAQASDIDVFGPSYYSDLPNFIFWALGKIGVAIGGANLEHMRQIHATSGVLIILIIFLLLRILKLPRYTAITGAVVVGLCHSLFFLSRMGMRDNTSLLFEAVALLFLMIGWQRRSYGWSLLGGFVGGLTFYTYYPSRITMFIWFSFVGLTLLIGHFKHWRRALKLSATALLGFFIIATPLFIANSKHTPTDPYPTNQFLFQQMGRDQEKQFRGTETTAEAIRINILHGLGAFNIPYTDQGLMYPHEGFGFVDKYTGALLWVGVAFIFLRLIYRRHFTENDLFAITGFFIVYLSLSFLLTRAPDYTRLLTVLPFLGYIIARGVGGIAGIVAARAGDKSLGRLLSWLIAAAVILVIGSANTVAVRDYHRLGEIGGDSVGDTVRYQEKHPEANAQWIFVYGSTQYFYWGIPDYWQFWLNFANGEDRPVTMIEVDNLPTTELPILEPNARGYMLTTGDVWPTIEAAFRERVQVLTVESLDPQRNRLVITYSNK